MKAKAKNAACRLWKLQLLHLPKLSESEIRDIEVKSDQKLSWQTSYKSSVYECFLFTAHVLSEKYGIFDDKYGVDKNGIVRKDADLITVSKLFDWAERHDWSLLGIPNKEVIRYFKNKFNKKINLSDNEKMELTSFLSHIFWEIHSEPTYFEKLLRMD